MDYDKDLVVIFAAALSWQPSTQTRSVKFEEVYFRGWFGL